MSRLRPPTRRLTGSESLPSDWATDPDAAAVPFALAVAVHWPVVTLAWWVLSSGDLFQIPAPLIGAEGPFRVALGVVGIALAVGVVGRRLWRHRLRDDPAPLRGALGGAGVWSLATLLWVALTTGPAKLVDLLALPSVQGVRILQQTLLWILVETFRQFLWTLGTGVFLLAVVGYLLERRRRALASGAVGSES